MEIPGELSWLTAAGLVALSFFTSGLTAAVGLGGGVLLLGVMASVLPPATLLPVHGIVQIGSNAGRAVLMRSHVLPKIVAMFALGAVAGVILGTRVFVVLPTTALQALIGLFILYSVWAPSLRRFLMPLAGYLAVGAVTTFLTMFVGGTGALVAAFLPPQRLGREGFVATHAVCMTLQHGLKVAAFGFIGFQLLPWLPLCALMIAAGFAGTVVGRRILLRLPEKVFLWAFRLVLTALALRLLGGALA